MDTVDELAVRPFREVVEKGKLAMENAGNDQDMLRESHRLVKTGERGLARIELSCRKLYNEYGNNFILALKGNDEITEYRKQITDLLWDFEDFIEAGTFEAAKFQELQALNREAAPKVYNILITMKLEAPNNSYSRSSPPSSPHPHPFSLISEPVPARPFGLDPSMRGSVWGSQGDARSVADCSHVGNAADQLRNLMSNRHLPSAQGHVPDVGFAAAAQGREGTTMSLPFEQSSHSPPRPPSLDPWDPQSAPSCRETTMNADPPVASANRRQAAHTPESPVDPAIFPMGFDLRRRLPTNAHQPQKGADGIYDQDTDEYSDYRYSGSSTESQITNATSQGARAGMSTRSPPIVEKDMPRKMNKPAFNLQQLHVRPPLPLPPPPRPPTSQSSASGRVEDVDRQYQAIRQVQRNMSANPLQPPPAALSCHERDAGHGLRNLHPRSGTSTPGSQPGLEVAVTVPIEDPDRGLIPVDSRDSSARSAASLSPVDCTIGPQSSFRQYKGFCEGAKEVVRGEIGVKKTKKPGFSAATTVARCTGCLYELDFCQIEYDVNKEERGTFYKSGINYRLRFLQKSHLPSKRVDDVLYACLFCVRAGRTINECDATVFTTSKALFDHLMRHPRPLPEIPGIAVVDGDGMPAHLRNDYDIHFLTPPEAHPAQLNRSQICGKPTGIARDQLRRLFGQRLPIDRTPALELCHGARVTGIEWPERYNGEWILAWHDGIRASAPFDIIKLDAPPSEDIRMVSSSLIRAKARWKFDQKEKEKEQGLWLKFDKNERITNISYVDPDFWCWSGTNSKGRWGLFPKLFLEPGSIQELTPEGADRAMTLNNEKNKSSSMLAKFAPRRRASGRPPSAARA